MGTFKLLCRDVIEALRPLPPNLFHGCLCDPPYGLKFMGKRWDHGVPGPEYWAEVLRVLKPGAPILAFGGTRTYHRLACAIEDAGFEVFDSILGSAWVYGQGFNKSGDLAVAAERTLTEQIYRGGKLVRVYVSDGEDMRREPPFRYQDNAMGKWFGYSAAIKPAWEPIVFARKPLAGTYAENCIEHGCGGLNIDGSRITGAKGDGVWGSCQNSSIGYGGTAPNGYRTTKHLSGRYPANLILSHHPDCSPLGTRRVPPRGGNVKPDSKGAGPRSNQVYGRDASDRVEWTAYKGEDGLEEVEAWECHPECPVAALDRQSGPRGSNSMVSGKAAKTGRFLTGLGNNQHHDTRAAGGASRFFHQSAWSPGELLEMCYSPKVSAAERNAGMDRKPLLSQGDEGFDDITVPPARAEVAHPTLKPLALTTYLAKLVLPPPHVSSRLLVPFCGTGSEIAGALLAGWSHVVGIDNDPESIATAQDRIPGLLNLSEKKVATWLKKMGNVRPQ